MTVDKGSIKTVSTDDVRGVVVHEHGFGTWVSVEMVDSGFCLSESGMLWPLGDAVEEQAVIDLLVESIVIAYNHGAEDYKSGEYPGGA